MLEPVLYICLAQSLFAGIVIASKRPQLLADRFLAAWLFIIGIETLLALVNLNFLDAIPYQLPFVVVPFIYGPLLLFYIRCLIFERPEIKWIELLHAAPFILLLGLAFLFPNQAGDQLNDLRPVTTTKLARIIFSLLLFLSLTTYSVTVYVLLDRHRRKIREEFSFRSGRITLNWLLFVSITIYVSYILTFLSTGLQWINISLPFDPKIFSYTGLTLFSFAFSFYGYHQAAIYHNNGDLVPHIMNGKNLPQKKYSKSKLTPDDLQKYLSALENLMEKKRLFMKPELSLNEVAQVLKVPRHHITQALNAGMGKNFYYYINEWRVKAVMARMQDPSAKHHTVLAIAYDCGFNSKSTFNSVFKQITGMTPSEYQQSLTL